MQPCLLSIWIFCEEWAGDRANANSIFHLEVHISVGKHCTHQSVAMMMMMVVNAHTTFFSPNVKVSVCSASIKMRERRKLQRQTDPKMHPASMTTAESNSVQRNETENFCLFVWFFISHSDEFTWLFRFRCVDFIPKLMNAAICMCMICSVWFIFMYSKVNVWVCFSFYVDSFLLKSIERYALAATLRRAQTDTRTELKDMKKLKQDDEMEENRHVRSIEWICCSARTKRIDSALVFLLACCFSFISFRTAIFSYTHMHTRTVFYIFFSFKNSAYYLRYTKLLRRNIAYHFGVCSAIGCVCACVWRTVACLFRFDASWKATHGHRNVLYASGTDKVNA